MSHSLATTLGFGVMFLSILLLIEYVYRKWQLAPEISRKLGHVIAILLSIPMIYWIEDHRVVFGLGLGFCVLLFLGKKYDWLKSIDSVDRKTAGSYILPISIYIMFYISSKNHSKLLYVLPLLILAISDPLAALVGTRLHKQTNEIKVFGLSLKKTYLGSVAFFMSSLLISLAVLYLYYPPEKILWVSLLIAIMGTLIELFSSRGFDNLTIPLGVSGVLIWIG